MDAMIWDAGAIAAAALGGLMIGGAAALLLLVNARIMGASGILSAVIEGQRDGLVERVAFLGGLIGVPAIVVALGDPPATNITTNWSVLVAAGLLVGLGTRLGSGCTSGHGVCGLSRLSPRSLVATGTFITAGVLTVRALG
ncbi:MAG: YeeE/YedE family protein [Pseudomonadota bacterium]